LQEAPNQAGELGRGRLAGSGKPDVPGMPFMAPQASTEAAMTAASDFARRLEAKRAGQGWTARCPAHDDRTASLTINETKDGKLLLHCHAGCDFGQIIDAAGVERARPNGQDRGENARIVASYNYLDASGKLAFQVIRYHPKAFKQRAP
jgi:putative DNA primase/helicase